MVNCELHQALKRRLSDCLMRIASSYIGDRTLIAETKGATPEVEIIAGASQRWVGGPTVWKINYAELPRLKLCIVVVLVGYTVTWPW